MKVRFFARARELAGTDAVDLDLPSATLAALRAELARRYPALAPLLAHSALAVNGEYGDDAQVLTGADEVAVLPPVSGG